MRTQDWLQPLRGRGLALSPVVNRPRRGIIQPPLNVQRRPLKNKVLPSHGDTLKEKCGIRNFLLALSADSAYLVGVMRNEIAKQIKRVRRSNPFSRFVKNHPDTLGYGSWCYTCDLAGWHAFIVGKALEHFGPARNLAQRVASKNPNVTLAELLEWAATAENEEAIEEITNKIKREERSNPGTICDTVKSACESAGIEFRRNAGENMFSTNLRFFIGDHVVRFDYCGGAMMRVACGSVQMMGLVSAFVNTIQGIPQYKAPANGGYPMSAFQRA